MLSEHIAADSGYVQARTDLRNHVARVLEQEAAAIVQDAIAVFPFAGMETSEFPLHNRLGDLILQLLVRAARDGALDARSAGLSDLRREADKAGLSPARLFGVVYVVERATLDQLALDESFGASSEPWASLAQIVRRASFDVLAGYAERLNRDPGTDALTDALTTLHTRAVVMAATDKEIQRAERFGHTFALILVDVDRFAEINARHGYGAGDRVLERLGILMRNYFREPDWVGRISGDGFAVLLPETAREHAALLAEGVRATVEGRMALHDYRSEEELAVTVSVGVVVAEAVDRRMRAEQIFERVQQAVHRAKVAGRNRVEVVDLAPPAAALPTRDITPLG